MPRRNAIALAAFLVVAAVALRVLRHFGLVDLPPNVAPIAAVALFGACMLPRRLALLLPLGAMLTSDLIIGVYHPGIMASVYGSFLLTVAIGWRLRGRRNPLAVYIASLASSTTFFLLTNAAVWAFGTLYPKTAGGLASAYVAGMPFFRNTLLGDLGFVSVLFGAYELVWLIARRTAPAANHPR